MICQIAQHAGYIALILCFWMFTISSAVRENKFTIQEFCSRNLYLHNLEPGETYKFSLKSKPSSKSFDKWYQLTKRICRQVFKTSNTAGHFVVLINDMDIPSCDHCRCNYFEISVSGHTKRFCGKRETDYFASKTDEISIEFHHGRNMNFDVSFTFTVERNFYIITGIPRENSVSSSYIETPYFPTPYPAGYKAEYVFQSDDRSGHVLLLFVDFQISHHSFIEVTGHNGTHLSRFYGNIFRPPVIISEFSQLTLKFQSSEEEGSMAGFRAVLSFIKTPDALIVPYTSCGGVKDDIGGFMNIEIQRTFRLYDCIWQIMPYFPLPKSNLSVFSHLRNIGFKSNLEFRCGRNSKAEILKEINCEVENCSSLDIETIIPASEDLYIRFNGYLDESSVLNFSYSTYHTGNCSSKEFRCKNGRCLKSSFQCDGISHCPDNSDEEDCPVTMLSEIEEFTTVQTQSYHSNQAENSFMYFLIVSCFALVAIVTITVYRYCKSVRAEPILPQRRSDELSGVQSTLHPVYPNDSLPSYEEFIKSSDSYPPPLFTREAIKETYSQRTTSFCSGSRIRHQSADSFPFRNCNTENRDIFLNIIDDVPNAAYPQSSNGYDIEIIQNNLSFKSTEGSLRRACSLDSKLNNLVNQDSCRFFLSIVHSKNSHLNNIPHVQWYTLPTNFKINVSSNENKPRVNEPFIQKIDSNVDFSRNRCLTWSIVPSVSDRSEFQTIVKTRCSSDPCSSISIHYCQLN